MKFEELGLCAELLRAIAEEGYTEPTPVQQQGIPPILRGQDVMAGAQTGTGKTAAFTLPMLQRLKQHANTSVSPARHPVRALIITPTRELAAQVFESMRTYGKYIPLRSACVYGGINIDPQIAELRAGVEILVATPGRLLDHVQQRTVNLGQVEILVLDEADRMLDMGFMPDIKRILALLPAKRQSLMFSATFPDDIKRLAAQMLKEPVRIQVAPSNAVTELVTHSAYKVDARRKRDFLEHLIRDRDMRQVLVFTGPRSPPPGWRASCCAMASPAPPCTATRPSRSARRRWPSSRTASCSCWWPPISPPAGWTSRICRTSSTTSCRTIPRTTSIASAAPAAPASRARRSRWWRPTRKRCWPASRSCSRRASRSPQRPRRSGLHAVRRRREKASAASGPRAPLAASDARSERAASPARETERLAPPRRSPTASPMRYRGDQHARSGQVLRPRRQA